MYAGPPGTAPGERVLPTIATMRPQLAMMPASTASGTPRAYPRYEYACSIR
jgi:hypothetical protein